MTTARRLVIERYPTEKLPAEWRHASDLGTEVRVTLEPVPMPLAEAISLEAILDEMQDRRVFSGDPVQRVRALRAEWDRRDEFHERIRAGDA